LEKCAKKRGKKVKNITTKKHNFIIRKKYTKGKKREKLQQ